MISRARLEETGTKKVCKMQLYGFSLYCAGYSSYLPLWELSDENLLRGICVFYNLFSKKVMAFLKKTTTGIPSSALVSRQACPFLFLFLYFRMTANRHNFTSTLSASLKCLPIGCYESTLLVWHVLKLSLKLNICCWNLCSRWSISYHSCSKYLSLSAIKLAFSPHASIYFLHVCVRTTRGWWQS